MEISKQHSSQQEVAEDFNKLYHAFQARLNDRKQNCRRDKCRLKQKQKVKFSSNSVIGNNRISPKIEVLGNTSAFASFTSARNIVLEQSFATVCQEWLNPGEDSETDNDNVVERPVSPAQLPKIVGLGLESIFKLIQETHTSHPTICVKVLESLLKILEGQPPQGLRKEPVSVLDSLLQVLLKLSSPPEKDIPCSSSSLISDGFDLRSLASSCLISLALARGDSKSILEAVSTLLVCPLTLSIQKIKNPEVFKSLQRSIQAVLVGRLNLPQWISHGIPANCCVEEFPLVLSDGIIGSIFTAKALTSDGKYLYLHCSKGLYKIGSGSSGSLKGHIYAANRSFHLQEKVWLGWASGRLFYKLMCSNQSQITILDPDTLQPKNSIEINENTSLNMFSDGRQISCILPSFDEGFVAKTLSIDGTVQDLHSELTLKLVKKSIEVCGVCPCDIETCIRPIVSGVEEDVSAIASGKDFALLRTTHGKILYCGKGASLGQKTGLPKCSKWLELGLNKCPKFVQFAVGHEGIHALLLAEDGSTYFVGTPKRGEDGDQAKLRRVSKASKPKKVIRMEGHEVSFIACNNGTSAFITKQGDAYMFGKDISHCDPITGYLQGLKGVKIEQIALGKAHAIMLTSDGRVYSMGINNKGQCGRISSHSKEDTHETGEEEEPEWDEGSVQIGVIVASDQDGICPRGTHRWKHEQCMVCTVCRECTGYGSACISALRPDRNPGQECGCGVGDAGCAECGSCRTCAREGLEDQEFGGMEQVIQDGQGRIVDFFNLEEDRFHFPEDQLERRMRAVTNSSKYPKMKGKESSMTSFSPSKVNLPTSFPIVQIACGLHHSLFLDVRGQVMGCGSNSYGQLGLGDIAMRSIPCVIKFRNPEVKIVMIAAGSYHSVALSSDGSVYTCGAYSKGQLGRDPEDLENDHLWFAKMQLIPNIGTAFGRKVSWIGASGDATFFRVEANLISCKVLQKSTVTANSNSIMIIPPPTTEESAKVIIISRMDGSCSYFQDENQLSLQTSAATLDPMFDFLWSYEWRKQTMRCFNVIASCIRNLHVDSNTWTCRQPYCVPVGPDSTIERWHAASSMLACLGSIVGAYEQGLAVHMEQQVPIPVLSKLFAKDDYSAVNRFEGHGGGWGYSGHSIEAIRFTCDTDILLGGFGLFGGRGEYCAKIKIYDIGTEGGEVEGDGELLAETEEVPYDCELMQKYRMMFDEPVALVSGKWYVAWAHITGPSSDCGSSGQGVVVTDDQVVFTFKSSKKSNNGTDVNSGQIPQLLYRLLSSDQSNNGPKTRYFSEPIYQLNCEILVSFNQGSIQLLMTLICWCWDELRGLPKKKTIPQFYLSLLKFVACCCLRLLDFSINQVYPLKKSPKPALTESASMAEVIGDVRSMLHGIIITPYENEKDLLLSDTLEEIIGQCCRTYSNCFNIFYPTSFLKWEALLNFMYLYLEKDPHYSCMLSCVVGALCKCRGQLLNIFPLLNEVVGHGASNNDFKFPRSVESSRLAIPSGTRKILIHQMTERNVKDRFSCPKWSVWEVLDNFLFIINCKSTARAKQMSNLVENLALLMSRVIEELVAHASGIYVNTLQHSELENTIGQVILATPSRFTRTNQSRTWNTGNGSPDAVCFSVDQSGVIFYGTCIYTGSGSYEYELELLQEMEESTSDNCDHSNAKWASLEIVKGTIDSDDYVGDIAEIKMNRPVHIKMGCKYAIKLKNQGGRTCNGDGGVTVLRCPEGTTFTFSSCSLSFNGTNQIRGQIPHLLYFRNPDDSEARQKFKAISETQARKCVKRLCTSIFDNVKQILENLGAKDSKTVDESCLVSFLLPSVISHLPNLAKSDPRNAVDLLVLIKQVLPALASLNNQIMTTSDSATPSQFDSNKGLDHGAHFCWVESDHPYKPASLTHFEINFPESVKIMTIEFDPRCCTSQHEDSLSVYIPQRDEYAQIFSRNIIEAGIRDSYITVISKCHGVENWPKKAVIVPGNKLLFSLETASDYTKTDKNLYFGFRCFVTGYEAINCSGLYNLEKELAFLGGLCAHELIVKDMMLPPVSAEELTFQSQRHDVVATEDSIVKVCLKHHALFAKGIGLEYFPDVHEALDGIVPLREKSKEKEFISNFIQRTPNTSGERLADWLQPQPFIEPRNCQVVASKESIKRGKPTVLMVITRDQYCEPVVAKNLKVQLKATPVVFNEAQDGQQSQVGAKPGGGRAMLRAAPEKSYQYCINGRKTESPNVPYNVTVKDKMRFHAITMMKDYENFSFEELRLISPQSGQSSESMLVRQNNNGTYTATWTPYCAGMYYITLILDGYSVQKACEVEVEENLDGNFQSSKTVDATENAVSTHMTNIRIFQASDSAGLRIRSHPTLQSEQIGLVPVNGVIGFCQEIHNDDGIWVKLDQNSVNSFCNWLERKASHTEGWCLQYNQHVGKTFLFPLEGSKQNPDLNAIDNQSYQNVDNFSDVSSSNFENSSNIIKLNRSPGLFQVVKCGISGHNIRTRPCLRSPPVGILVMGCKFYSIDEHFNNEGVWVKLDRTSQRKYCFTSEGEAWSLCIGKPESVYLRRIDITETNLSKGFDFSSATQSPQNIFQNVSPPAAFTGPLSMTNSLTRNIYLNEDTSLIQQQDKRLEPQDSKTDIEEEAKEPSSCDSPVSRKVENQENVSQEPAKTFRTRSSSTFGAIQKWFHLGSEARSNSSSQMSQPLKQQASTVVEVSKSLVKERFCSISSRSQPPPMSDSATQTSPDQGSTEGHVECPTISSSGKFNIGSDSPLSHHVTSAGNSHGKIERRRKSNCGRSKKEKKSSSPSKILLDSGISFEGTVKEAMGPEQAQSIRAVFGAVLWHSGTVHDAMACATYLKFLKSEEGHECLVSDNCKQDEENKDPERKNNVVLRKKIVARPKKNRHSVEITSAAWYLKENPEIKLKPLDSEEKIEPDNCPSKSDDAEEKYPRAMIALQRIWKYINLKCMSTLVKEPTLVEAKRAVAKSKKEYKKSSGAKDAKVRAKREKQSHSAAEDRSDMQDCLLQCELCSTRFPNNGKSRKSHFGFSTLCESCSERHLKLRKRVNAPTFTSSPQNPSTESQNDCALQMENNATYSMLLNNALFLVHMVNDSPKFSSHQPSFTSKRNGFHCLQHLGVKEIDTKEDVSYEDISKEFDTGLQDCLTETNFKRVEQVDASSQNIQDGSFRARKSSNGHKTMEDAKYVSLLENPTFVLRSVLSDLSNGDDTEEETMNKICSNVLAFVSEWHDLDSLRLYLFQTVRRVTCQSFGMQALEYLLKNVSLVPALHDLIWWYASCLDCPEKEPTEFNPTKTGLDDGWWQIRNHPLSESPASIFPLLLECFYDLMQTISDIMPYLPIGSPLLEIAVKCWGLRFSRKDHRFLHKSKIFRNLSQIMSKFDGDQMDVDGINDISQASTVAVLQDLTGLMEVKVTSRGPLCSSLTDCSTETFWESGDEDKNRSKCITVISAADLILKIFAIHIDNGRDSQYKVSSISVKAGPHPDEYSKVGHLDIDSRHSGWVWFKITVPDVRVMRVELKGPDNSLRVRQIKILGTSTVISESIGGVSVREISPVIAQRKCENETLRIFCLLSSEVFGKFLYGSKKLEVDSEVNNLQEHLVGILFSRNKLTHLQKQVCSYIVSAIHRESVKIKEEFDCCSTAGSLLEATGDNVGLKLEKSKVSDRYCFEMLELVLALADHELGIMFLSQQSNLIKNLVQLIHIGTPRIQRQVDKLIKSGLTDC